MVQKTKRRVGAKPKPVLQKISKQVPLTEEDKQYLADLIEVFKKSKKGKELDESELQFINELLEMRKLSLASGLDYIRTCGNLLHVIEYFNNT